jgi:hypothetical protein
MPATLVTSVLHGSDAEEVLRSVDVAAPGLRRRLGASLGNALRGRPAGVRRYVAAYGELVDAVLASVHEAHPDVVVRDDAGAYCVAHAGGCSRAPVDLLRSFAGDAPFSAWVHSKGLGAGVVLDLVARLRALLPGAEPLALPARASLPGYAGEAEALLRFTRLVAEAQQAERSDLERVRAVFGLSITELGALFGVTRQAAGLWLTDGPPAARRAKAAAVAAIADLLAHRLKPARVPGVARRPAPAYGGRSMLEVIAADEHEWLLEDVRRSFDYAATA